MRKDTIIFDLDGTLLNTLEDLHACFNYAIQSFGYPQRTLEEIKSFVGNGITKAIELALPFAVSREELDKIAALFKSYYQEHMFEHTKPYDGVLPLLKQLKENGYKTAVVSNKFDGAVKGLCKNYFGKYIDFALGEGYGIRKKPETDGIIKVVAELNSSLENCIYTGDSQVDIKTAENAGIPCISVLWGFKDKDFLINNGGKIFAQKPQEIIQIIKSI